MSSLDRLLTGLAHSLCRNRVKWAGAFLVVTLTAIASIFQIKISLDAKDFLPSHPLTEKEHALEQLNKEVVKTFGGKSPTVIVLRGDKKIEVDRIAPLIEHLAKKIETIEGVQKVNYRLESKMDTFIKSEIKKNFLLYLNAKDMDRFSKSISRSNMELLILGDKKTGQRPSFFLNRDPLGIFKIARPYFFDLLTGFRIGFVDGYFSSRNQQAFFILIEPKISIRNAEDAKAITGSVDAILDEARLDPQFDALLKEITLRPIGRPYIYASTFDTTMRDAKQALYTSAIAIFLLLIMLYKRFTAAIIIMLPVLFGLIVTMALGVWIFPSINLFSLLFATLLAGLGVDFAIHIGTHYWMHSDEIQSKEEAVIQALIRPGKGILFGALTTAAAFSALAFSQYSGISQTGILTAIGIMTMFLSSITLFPFLISKTQKSPRPPSGMRRWTNAFAFLSERHPKIGIVFWIVLVLIGTVGVTRVTYEDHPWSVAVRGNKNAAELLDLNKQIGMSFTPLLVISRGETETEAIEKDRQVSQILSQIRKKGGIAFFQSITSLLPNETQQRKNIATLKANPDLFSAERFRRDFHEILRQGNRKSKQLFGSYTNQIANTLTPPRTDPIQLEDLKRAGLETEIGRFVGKIGQDHLAITYVYLKQFPWVKGVVTQFTNAFESAGGDQLEGVSLAGEGMQSVRHANLLKREVLQVGSIALVLVATLLFLAFKRLSSVIMTLLPLMASVWITLGIIGFMGIEINFLTLSIIPILLGIGIDDGLHMMERYRKEGDIQLVLKETGSGLTATSLTTAFAFLSFCIAENDVVRDFGWVASIGIGICLLASLHLLPCLFAYSKARAGNG